MKATALWLRIRIWLRLRLWLWLRPQLDHDQDGGQDHDENQESIATNSCAAALQSSFVISGCGAGETGMAGCAGWGWAEQVG